MFDILDSLSARGTVAAVHQAIRILRHMRAVPIAEREFAVRTLQEILREPETDAALALVRAIEAGEGKPLGEMSPSAVDRYASELAEAAERKTGEEFSVDPERGRELLSRMRTAAARADGSAGW